MADSETCVHEALGEAEAQQVKVFLEAHGIPCELRGETLRNTYGFTLNGLGMAHVHVAPEHAEQARELLAKAESGELALREGEEQPERDGDRT
jgi:hypothetical protein